MRKLLLILLSFPMFGWGQCISGDCEDGTGKAQLSTGIYEGEFLNGIPNGKGKLELNRGNVYEGNFLNGGANGKGIMTYGPKNRYEGEFLNNQPNGKGVLYSEDESVYEGSFLNGNPSGEGFVKLKNGETFTGSFENGERHGWGKLNLDEKRFQVKYHKGRELKRKPFLLTLSEYRASNKKTRKYLNGDIYTGEQVHLKRTGHGTMEYKNGDEYTGSWENDLKNGSGKMHYDNGDEYSGNWHKGKRQGVGRLLKNDRKKSAGEYNGGWYNDKMHGEGTFLWKDSSLLVADFIEGMPTGHIEYQNAGEFKNNIDKLQISERYSYTGEIDLDFFRENWVVAPKGKGVLEYGGVKYGVDISYWHSIKKYGRTVKGPSFTFNTIPLEQAKDHLSEKSIACERPSAPPKLVLSDVRFYDSDSDSILDPGETGRVTFILKNEGEGTACNLIPKLSSHTSFNEIEIKNTKTIKKLQAGEEAYVEINILALETASNNKIELEIDIVEGNGFDLFPKRPIVISTQELLLPDIRIVDAEFYSTNGGKAMRSSVMTLKYIVQNLGQGKAEDIKVKFSLPENVYAADDLNVNIDRLKSGEDEIEDFQFFVNARFIGDKIDINLDIEEKNGKYARDTTLTMEFENELRSAKKVSFAVQQRKNDKQPIKIVSLNSLVDKNIPVNNKVNNRFALVIGNEDYTSSQRTLSSEQNVDYAENDATIFKKYCLNTFGVKEENMFGLINSTAGEMSREIKTVTNLIYKTVKFGEVSELIVYYAGHGYPDEITKVPYLIPVDVSSSDLSSAIKLDDLYQQLANTNASKITIFLDACFTGGGRNAGLVASRGVTVKPKEGTLNGNIVVFSASSAEQSSLPYKDEKHGMFTYFLLKKFKETNGDISLGELSKYLEQNVALKSLRVHKKDQDPTVNTSEDVKGIWKDWKF